MSDKLPPFTPLTHCLFQDMSEQKALLEHKVREASEGARKARNGLGGKYAGFSESSWQLQETDARAALKKLEEENL